MKDDSRFATTIFEKSFLSEKNWKVRSSYDIIWEKMIYHLSKDYKFLHTFSKFLSRFSNYPSIYCTWTLFFHKKKNDSENTKRPLGSRLLGPRASVAAFAVFVAVCTVCAASAVACAALLLFVLLFFMFVLLLLLLLLLLLIPLVLFSCVAAVWCSLLFVQLASACAAPVVCADFPVVCAFCCFCCSVCLCCWILLFLLMLLLLLLCAAFPVLCAAVFCCFCGCCLGRRPLNPTLAAFDLRKCQEQLNNWWDPFDLRKCQEQFFCIPEKAFVSPKKTFVSHKNHFGLLHPTKRLLYFPKKRIPRSVTCMTNMSDSSSRSTSSQRHRQILSHSSQWDEHLTLVAPSYLLIGHGLIFFRSHRDTFHPLLT